MLSKKDWIKRKIMTQLYKIANEFQYVEDLNEMSKALINTLEGIKLEFYDKAENIIALIKNMKSTSNALKIESESLIKRKKTIDNKIFGISNYLLINMQKIGIKKLERGPHLATLRLGKEIVIIDNVDDLSDKLITIKPEILANKIAILSAYKAGNLIKGAHIERAQTTLNIK